MITLPKMCPFTFASGTLGKVMGKGLHETVKKISAHGGQAQSVLS